jgi:hypothetical protein
MSKTAHLPWPSNEPRLNPRASQTRMRKQALSIWNPMGGSPCWCLIHMAQAPRRFVVNRQSAKPRQNRSYPKKLSVKERVSREATACQRQVQATLSHMFSLCILTLRRLTARPHPPVSAVTAPWAWIARPAVITVTREVAVWPEPTSWTRWKQQQTGIGFLF